MPNKPQIRLFGRICHLAPIRINEAKSELLLSYQKVTYRFGGHSGVVARACHGGFGRGGDVRG